jgi:CubicO group peptidase (beta-lactamase class C family)
VPIPPINKEMKSIKRLYVILIIILIHSGNLHAQSELLANTDSLDSYIHNYRIELKLPGLSIAIIRHGKIFYQKGYGVQLEGTKDGVDEHTLFPIASVTKTFTGTAIATLAAEAKCKLDDYVGKYVPSFRPEYEPYKDELTLTDVLSHRSGWKTFQGDLLNTESTLNDEQLVNRLNNIKPAYPLRTKFGYSNMGFLLAGLSVKNISGLSWQEYLEQRIFNPLGMRHTFTDSQHIKSYRNIAIPHTIVNGMVIPVYNKYESPRGYGGMYSTVNDLSKWMQMLLDSGRFEGSSIIPYNAIAMALNSYTIIGKQHAGDRKPYFKTYGLGWEIMQYHGTEVVQHGGAYSGALSMFAMIPSLKCGVIILTNGDYHPMHETLKWQILDALIGKPAPDYTRAAIERRRQRQTSEHAVNNPDTPDIKNLEIPQLIKQTIAGEYHCPGYGKAKIKNEDNHYTLYLENHPNLTGALRYKGNNVFECLYSNPIFGKCPILFHIQNNIVTHFDLCVDAFVEDTIYTFYRK